MQIPNVISSAKFLKNMGALNDRLNTSRRRSLQVLARFGISLGLYYSLKNAGNTIKTNSDVRKQDMARFCELTGLTQQEVYFQELSEEKIENAMKRILDAFDNEELQVATSFNSVACRREGVPPFDYYVQVTDKSILDRLKKNPRLEIEGVFTKHHSYLWGCLPYETNIKC